MDKEKLGPFLTFLGTLSFIVFGAVGYMNLKTPWDKTNLAFGIVIGLLFGWITKKFITFVLTILNSDIKKQHGKQAIAKTVSRSTVFMFPFALLVFLSAYFLGWAAATVFYSAAVMNTGVLASAEIGKLKGKSAIKNSIATSISASLMSYLWMFASGYLKDAPALMKSLVSTLLPLVGVKL